MTNQTQPRQRRSRSTLKRVIEEAFRREFPRDTVDVSDGYKDNIHVLVVSRRFDSMTEKAKQEMLWEVIDSAHLTKSEKRLISLVYPLSVAELKWRANDELSGKPTNLVEALGWSFVGFSQR